MADRTFCIKLKTSSPIFQRKPTIADRPSLVLHGYFITIRVFQANLSPTYLIDLLHLMLFFLLGFMSLKVMELQKREEKYQKHVGKLIRKIP